jgi:DeoR family fructose operon transcriptional repressor
MLTEKRYELILELLDKKRSVTVPEIKEVLGVSESTIRRDLNALDKAGRLTKVFGGAVSSDGTFTGTEPSVAQKMELQQEEKRRIAQFAAGLIQPDDFVYLTVERNQELFEDVETVVWRDEVPEKDG